MGTAYSGRMWMNENVVLAALSTTLEVLEGSVAKPLPSIAIDKIIEQRPKPSCIRFILGLN